jgi:ABC-type transport system substrate-binding protein
MEIGLKLQFEAFEHYYRPVHIKNLTMLAVPEEVTRLAMLERGEADIIYGLSGELADRVRRIQAHTGARVVRQFLARVRGFQDPNNPFHDKRVREAVSLAIDHKTINEAESVGLGKVSGNWINNDVQYGLEWPDLEFNREKARALMREAGHPNGFTVDWLTPLAPFYSRGEAIVAQLQAIGIRARNQVMERGVFLPVRTGNSTGIQIIMQARIGGTWSTGMRLSSNVAAPSGRPHCVRSWMPSSTGTTRRLILQIASSWRRRCSVQFWSLLSGARISPRLPERNGRELTLRNGGTCFNRHHRLRLSMGRHQTQG